MDKNTWRYNRWKSRRKSKRAHLDNQFLQAALDIETQYNPIYHPCFQFDPSWTIDGDLYEVVGLKENP